MKIWPCLPLLLLSLPLQADTLRCGNRLVYEGDPMAVVQTRCGAPMQVSHSSMFKIPSVWLHGRLYQLSNQEVLIPVETWIYNFGSSRFMRQLRFEDGILIKIETLEYGH